MPAASSTVKHHKTGPAVIGLLLVYYEPYALNSIRRFTSFLNSVSKESILIVINNGDFELPMIEHREFCVVSGDNSLREFSGWQGGIQYCYDQGLLSQDGILIVANDTFCHHNKFGPITQLAFRRAFRRLAKMPTRLAIAGEVHCNGYDYSIANKPFSSWVSTYLFAMTISLTKKIGGVLPNDVSLDGFFSGKTEMEDFLAGPISENLKQHIQRWLFGIGARSRWYGSAQLCEANKHQFIGKAKSILCEKILSATAASLDAELVSVFSSPSLRQARKLERLMPR